MPDKDNPLKDSKVWSKEWDDWDFLCENRFFSDAPDEEMLQSEFVTGTGITRNKNIYGIRRAAPLSVRRDVFLIVFSLVVSAFLGVTGIFRTAPGADVLAIAITSMVMVRLWKQLKEEDKSVVPGKILPEYIELQGLFCFLFTAGTKSGSL